MKAFTLITGASSGIGLELALIAAREKRNLVLVARDKKRLEEVRQQILGFRHPELVEGSDQISPPVRQAHGTLQGQDDNTIEILALDLSKPQAAQKVFEFCEKKNIFITELINNAGFGDYGYFSKSNLKRQLAMIDLNIRSVTELTHLFLPAMVQKKSGKIMNLGSVASFLPGPLMSVYFASKSYVLRFSEAIGEELQGSGVTITCLCPGSTKTNFGKSAQVSKTHSTATSKVSPRDVAEFGWYHMQHGTRVAIYGFGNRVMIQFTKFIPRNLLAKLVKKIQR